jgi:hypothetical protein
MDFDKPKGRGLAKALIEAFELWQKLVDDGTSRAEADKIVGHALQVEWGSGREATYRCWKCRDTGYVFHEEPTKLYGPEWPTVRRASRCAPACTFLLYERKHRQEVLGLSDEPLVSAGRTTRKARP